MDFDLAMSLSENLARFREDVERVDADYARVLFDNLALLLRDGDAANTRQAVQEFNMAVLAALEGLPEGSTT